MPTETPEEARARRKAEASKRWDGGYDEAFVNGAEYGEAHGYRKALEVARDAVCGPCSMGVGMVADGPSYYAHRAAGGGVERCTASNIRYLLADLEEP